MGAFIEDLALRFIRENKIGPDSLVEELVPGRPRDLDPHEFYQDVAKEKLKAWFKKKRFTLATLAKITAAGRSAESGYYLVRASVATVLGCQVSRGFDEDLEVKPWEASRLFELTPRAMITELAACAIAAEAYDQLVYEKYKQKA